MKKECVFDASKQTLRAEIRAIGMSKEVCVQHETKQQQM